MQEIERNSYENSHNIFVKIFLHGKFKKDKQRLMLEKRTSSVIRTIAKECINNSESELSVKELTEQVKKLILESTEKYLKK